MSRSIGSSVPRAVEVIAIAMAAHAPTWKTRDSRYIQTTAATSVVTHAITARAPSRDRIPSGSTSSPASRNSIPRPSWETNETSASACASPSPFSPIAMPPASRSTTSARRTRGSRPSTIGTAAPTPTMYASERKASTSFTAAPDHAPSLMAHGRRSWPVLRIDPTAWIAAGSTACCTSMREIRRRQSERYGSDDQGPRGMDRVGRTRCGTRSVRRAPWPSATRTPPG